MKNLRYRVFVDGKMKDVQALFWDKDFSKVTEIRIFDDSGDVEAVQGDGIPIMQCTGFQETGSNKLVFQGDIVEVEYQYGTSLCVVEWCDVKYGLILNPVRGEKPKHKPHFRIPGKRSIMIRGNIYEDARLLDG